MELRTRNFLLFALLAGLTGSAVAPRATGCNPLTGQCPGGSVRRPAIAESSGKTASTDLRPVVPTWGVKESH